MIEVIYSEESKDGSGTVQIKLPRNVRQIGNGGEYRKIYVEDYVMTYLSKIWEQPKEEYLAGVLLGDVKKANGITYIFISGAVQVSSTEITGKGLIFSDETWTGIYETMKQYFNDLEIVGWFLVQNDSCKETDDAIYQTHVDNFGGIDKVLLLADMTEKEEEFYVYDNNSLAKTEGYYIYYEKNDAMQEYMVEQRQGKTIESEVEDRITPQYRTIIQEKKETGVQNQKRVITALYSACTCLAVVVLAIGVVIMNNYDKMKTMEENLSYLTTSLLNGQKDKFAMEDDLRDKPQFMWFDSQGNARGADGDGFTFYVQELSSGTVWEVEVEPDGSIPEPRPNPDEDK